jgi:type IV fimbrial biogenesis protein FimT
MVVISIAAALAALALPSFSRQIAEIRRTNAINAFTKSFALARSTSLKSPRAARMCISIDRATCAAAGTALGNWALGWIVYSDVDASGTFTAAADTILQTQAPLGGILSSFSNPVINQFDFFPNGLLGNAANTITVISTNTSISQKQMNINRLGRISTTY